MAQERQWWPGLAAAKLEGKQMYSRDTQEVGRLDMTCLHLEDEENGRGRHDSWFLIWMTVWVVVAILEKRNTGGGTGLAGR